MKEKMLKIRKGMKIVIWLMTYVTAFFTGLIFAEQLATLAINCDSDILGFVVVVWMFIGFPVFVGWVCHEGLEWAI